MKKGKILLILGLCLSVFLLMMTASSAWTLSRNTLENNGHWVSTKTLLDNRVMGAFAAVKQKATLAGARLNLAAFFGFQEFLWKEKIDLETVSFDFMLEPGAYLHFIFNKNEDGFEGVRLSIHPDFESIYYRASNLGEFQHKQPLQIPGMVSNADYRISFSTKEDTLRWTFDHGKTGTLPTSFRPNQRFGFRGSLAHAYIDNVVIVDGKQNKTRDSFDKLKASKHPLKLILPLILVLNLLVGGFWRFVFKHQANTVLANTILLNGVAALICGLVILFFHLKPPQYGWLNADARHEEDQLIEKDKQAMRARVLETPASQSENTHRIAFIGGSQMWGSGASESKDTIVNQLRALITSEVAHQDYELINLATPGLTTVDIMEFYEALMSHLSPATTVISISVNDSIYPPTPFKKNLERMLAINKRLQIQTILIQEPQSAEYPNFALQRYHADMAQLAQSTQTKMIKMNDYLKQKKDAGFLWWDTVHLTSFGQKLFAEKLFESLAK